jgi:hypothetical protein
VVKETYMSALPRVWFWLCVLTAARLVLPPFVDPLVHALQQRHVDAYCRHNGFDRAIFQNQWFCTVRTPLHNGYNQETWPVALAPAFAVEAFDAREELRQGLK